MKKSQNAAFEHLRKAQQLVLSTYGSDPAAGIKYLEGSLNGLSSRIIADWWAFAWTLVAKFSDGYIVTGEGAQPLHVKLPGYSKEWLTATDYNGWPHGTFNPPNQPKFNLPNKMGERATEMGKSGGENGVGGGLGMMTMSAGVIGVGLVAYLAGARSGRRHAYQSLQL